VLTIYVPQIVLLDMSRSAYSVQSQWIGKFDTKTKSYKTICFYGTPRFVTVLVRQ